MLKEGEKQPHMERRAVNRVSSAVWPLNARRVVATGRAAQRRRDWIIQGRRWVTLADALPMRVLLVIATLLVVANSLLVAMLGLRFWFLLPPPLLLFLAVLVLPLFLANRMPAAPIPSSFSGLVQEPRSSSGLLSPPPREAQSSPGFPQHPKSKAGLLTSEAPATPMPVGQPLVRVLETYDLRHPQVREQAPEMARRDTGHHRALLAREQSSWQATAATGSRDEQQEIPEDSSDSE
ncbi:MAG TPA: hypothetical protein VGF67_13015 [Ktedonobacteraceae bacterium]|jgi:hypothetical protein